MQAAALGLLLLLAGLALAGPSGLLAWRENAQLSVQREAEVAALTKERDALQNLVDRLDPANADPDLASELVRRDLNMIHEDEIVLILPEGDQPKN